MPPAKCQGTRPRSRPHRALLRIKVLSLTLRRDFIDDEALALSVVATGEGDADGEARLLVKHRAAAIAGVDRRIDLRGREETLRRQVQQCVVHHQDPGGDTARHGHRGGAERVADGDDGGIE